MCVCELARETIHNVPQVSTFLKMLRISALGLWVEITELSLLPRELSLLSSPPIPFLYSDFSGISENLAVPKSEIKLDLEWQEPKVESVLSASALA